MRHLLLKCCLLAITSVAIFLGWSRYLLVSQHEARTGNDKNAVYVFGDSRTAHGIDFGLLRKTLGKPVHNYSSDGAGAYDLLVFSELVPAGATVLVGATQSILARPPALDLDGIGYSFSALWKLWGFGYSVRQVQKVFLRSRFPHEYDDNPGAYPITDAPKTDQLDELRRVYSGPVRDSYDTKWLCLIHALETLAKKNCRVVIVDYPIAPQFQELLAKSEYRDYGKRLRNLTPLRLGKVLTDVRLESDENLMFDQDHLNERGRRLMTEYVARHGGL